MKKIAALLTVALLVAIPLFGITGCGASNGDGSSSSSSASSKASSSASTSKSYSTSDSSSKSSSSSSSSVRKSSSSKSSSSAKETGRYYNKETGGTLYTYDNGTQEYTDGRGNVVRGKDGKTEEYSTDGGKTWKKYK